MSGSRRAWTEAKLNPVFPQVGHHLQRSSRFSAPVRNLRRRFLKEPDRYAMVDVALVGFLYPLRSRVGAPWSAVILATR